MIGFSIAELAGDSICTLELERHLHPSGLTCLHCEPAEWRLFRTPGRCPAYRRWACEGYDTLLDGTAFATTRQRPAE